MTKAQKKNGPTQKFWTHLKDFNPRKDPRKNIFDPNNPGKNYDPRKKYFDGRNPRNRHDLADSKFYHINTQSYGNNSVRNKSASTWNINANKIKTHMLTEPRKLKKMIKAFLINSY